jgi:hypothetical protein
VELTPEQIALALTALGILTAGYGAFRTIRRVVHFFDALEEAATEMTQAVHAVNHHLSPNGGRLERPLSEESARGATVMDLLLDMRALLHNLRTDERKHDAGAEARVERIIKGVVAHTHPPG